MSPQNARHAWLAVGLVCAVLTLLLAVQLKPYRWNPSALFHLDREMSVAKGVPPGFVVLTVPGYDGMQYYEIARTLPLLVQPAHWDDVAIPNTIAYSYQRILLPIVAWLLALGQVAWLPWSFLFINVASLIACTFLMTRLFPGKTLYAVALALCPAALVGLHFSLAEPLTLLILTVFLGRFSTRDTIRTPDVLLLVLLVLSREVNVLFVGLFVLWLLSRKRWADAALMLIPLCAFFCLHGFIYAIFRETPFLWSAGKRSLPLQAIADLVRGKHGYSALTVSSIALLIGVVVPGLVWTVKETWNERGREFIPLAACAFFLLMFLMPDDIWGSITSIGRVITPVYPLALFATARADTWPARFLACTILLIGLGAGIGLAEIAHPFMLS